MINRGELEGRLDGLYYLLNKPTKYKTIKLKKYLIDVFQGQVQGKLERNLIKVLKIKNLNLFGDIDFKNVTFVDCISKRKLLCNGDILTPFRGQTIYTKKFAYFEYSEKVTIDNNLGVIRLNDKLILPKFFYYYISSNIGFNEILKNIVGAGIPALTKHIISEFKIPLLTNKTQQNIINIMDNAYKVKKQKEQKAKELLDGIDDYLLDKLGISLPKEPENSIQNRTFRVGFDDVFNNRLDSNYHKPYYKIIESNLLSSNFHLIKLIDVLIFIESGSRPKGGVSNIKDGILSLGGEHVKVNLQIDTSTKPKYISKKFHNNILLTSLKLNDILIVKDGATTGKIGIIKNDREVNQNINEHLFLLRFNNTCNKDYIATVLTSSFFQLFLKKEITGATVTGITKDAIKYLKIPLPNLDIQNEIATEINKRRKEAKELQKDAKELLKKAKQNIEKIILGDSHEA